MSTIRDLITEDLATGGLVCHALIKKHHPNTSKADTAILDREEVAVVFTKEGSPLGMLLIDWSEPCLTYKPLSREKSKK